MLKGIDVSKYQSMIDWQKVKNSGIEFAYMRVLDDDGISPDPTFEFNWIESKKAGLLRGWYVPYYFWNDPNKVSDNIFNILDKFDRGDWNFGMGELPSAIDIEPSSIYQSPEHSWDKLLNFISNVKSRCLAKPIIYTGYYTWNQYVNPNNNLKFDEPIDLWIAGYVYAGNHQTTFNDWSDSWKPFNIPNNFDSYKIWQWAGDDGKVDGINTACDLDVWRGTYEELVEWGHSHKILEIDTEPEVETKSQRVGKLFKKGKISDAIYTWFNYQPLG